MCVMVMVLASAGAFAATGQAPAMVLEQGSVTFSQVVAMSRDLIIEGDCRAGAAVVGGSARVRGTVDGDLVVLGGSAALEEGARIKGDVFVLGGTLESAGTATVDGQAVAYPSAPSTWVLLLEGPALGRSAFDPFVLATRLTLLAAWLLVGVLLMSVTGRQMVTTADTVVREPARCFFVGLTGVLAVLMTILLFSSFAAAVVGVPIVLLLLLGALLLKLWGTVAVVLAFGRFVLARLGRARELPLTAVLAGLLSLGLVKFLPMMGTWVWTVVTLVGVGAALLSKFGRREPWLMPA